MKIAFYSASSWKKNKYLGELELDFKKLIELGTHVSLDAVVKSQSKQVVEDENVEDVLKPYGREFSLDSTKRELKSFFFLLFLSFSLFSLLLLFCQA
jgi:hypothetical protein